MKSNSSEWFRRQIEANTELIGWAAQQLSSERFSASPPSLLGEWPAARHLFHLLYYEREVALPSLRQWFGAPYPTFEGYDENAAFSTAPPEDVVMRELQSVRAEQMALIAHADGEVWDEVRRTAWGDRSFYWVVSKTLQHGLEHANNILKIALLWEHYEERSRTKAAQVVEIP